MSPAVLIVIVSGFCLLWRLPPVRGLTRSLVGPRLTWLIGPAEPSLVEVEHDLVGDRRRLAGQHEA
jgi:hypothetical protein